MIDLTYLGIGFIIGNLTQRLTRKNDPMKNLDSIMVGIGLALIIVGKIFA